LRKWLYDTIYFEFCNHIWINMYMSYYNVPNSSWLKCKLLLIIAFWLDVFKTNTSQHHSLDKCIPKMNFKRKLTKIQSMSCFQILRSMNMTCPLCKTKPIVCFGGCYHMCYFVCVCVYVATHNLWNFDPYCKETNTKFTKLNLSYW
jgi:hypothetical protein